MNYAEFAKILATIAGTFVTAILTLYFGMKSIDYYYPSKFDKLIHCKKDN